MKTLWVFASVAIVGLSGVACNGGDSGGTWASSKNAQPKAGSIGECIPFEISPGKSVCLLSASQEAAPLETSAAALEVVRQALGNEPDDIDLLDTAHGCSSLPISDQDSMGWCVAHAVAGAMELRGCLEDGGLAAELSEPHLWLLGDGYRKGADALGLDSQNKCPGGWYISTAVEHATAEFLVTAETWPPASDSASDLSDCAALTGSKARSDCACEHNVDEIKQSGVDLAASADSLTAALYANGVRRIVSSNAIGAGDVDAVRAAIAQEYPVAYAFWVLKSAGWSGTSTSIQVPDDPPPSDSFGNPVSCKDSTHDHCSRGGHAIVLVGYDEDTRRFRLLNSWGDDWKGDGTSWVDYDYLEAYGKGGRSITKTTCRAEGCAGSAGPDCPADKDCGGRECGPDPVCGASCGTCSGNDECVNGGCFSGGGGPGDPCQGTIDCTPGHICWNHVCVGQGALRFSLAWQVLSDFDLHVVTPMGNEIYYGDQSYDGGELDVDDCVASCRDESPGAIHVENIFFLDDAPEGQYEVWVKNYSGEKSGDYTLEAQPASGSVLSTSGSLPADNVESQHWCLNCSDEECHVSSGCQGGE